MPDSDADSQAKAVASPDENAPELSRDRSPLGSFSRQVLTAQRAALWVISWWVGELVSMVPALLARAWTEARRPSTTLVLSWGNDLLELSSGTPMIPLPSAENDAEALVRARLQASKLDNTATIRLETPFVFTTHLALPSAAEGSLKQIVGHQIERLVPLAANEVRFSYEVIDQSSESRSIRVQIAIVKQATIDRALARARALGLDPRMVVARSMAPSSNASAIFWRAGQQQSRQRRTLRIVEALIVGLLLVAYGLHVYRLGRIRDMLKAEVAAATKDAESAQSKVQYLARSDAALAFLQARRQAVTPLRVLEELTRTIPTDAWLNQMTIQGDVIELTGTSRHATDLIPRIESSPLFAIPRFRSPITLSPDGLGERFNLGFEIRPSPVAKR